MRTRANTFEEIMSFTAVVRASAGGLGAETEVVRVMAEDLSHAIGLLQDDGYQVHHVFQGVIDDLVE